MVKKIQVSTHHIPPTHILALFKLHGPFPDENFKTEGGESSSAAIINSGEGTINSIVGTPTTSGTGNIVYLDNGQPGKVSIKTVPTQNPNLRTGQGKIFQTSIFSIPYHHFMISPKMMIRLFPIILDIYLCSYKNTIVSRRLILLSSGDIWNAYANSEPKTW